METDNQYDAEVVDEATQFQKREIAVSTRSTDMSNSHLEEIYRDKYRQVKSPPSSPTDKPKPHRRQSTATHIDKSTKMSTGTSSKKSTDILLNPHVESGTLKLTGRSPKRTSKDDCRVNATYR